MGLAQGHIAEMGIKTLAGGPDSQAWAQMCYKLRKRTEGGQPACIRMRACQVSSVVSDSL